MEFQTINQTVNQKVQYEKLNSRKHCKGCDEIKPLDQFTKSKHKCKNCMSIVNNICYLKRKAFRDEEKKIIELQNKAKEVAETRVAHVHNTILEDVCRESVLFVT